MRSVVTLAFCVALTACGAKDKETNVTTPDGTKATVATAADGGFVGATATAADGSTASISGEGGKWPADAPAYASPYPGGAYAGGMSNSNGASSMLTMMFKTADAPDKVIDYYKAKAEAAGAKGGSMLDMAEAGKTWSTTLADGASFSVTASPEEGATRGQLTIIKQ